MEQNLPAQNQNQGLEISENINSISKAIFHVNQLTPYPYTDSQIIDWAKSIEELTPELKPKTLKLIMDKMKLGIIAYDHRIGIQNVFNGYKIILKDRSIELHSKKAILYTQNKLHDKQEGEKIDKEIHRIQVFLSNISSTK